MISWQPVATASQDTELVLFHAKYEGGSCSNFVIGRWSNGLNGGVDDQGEPIVPTHWARLTEP